MRTETQMPAVVPVWREFFGIRETPAEYVFHRPRLYLETTIPSYLTARPGGDWTIARLQQTTARWWNSWRTNFHIYVSNVVLKEAAGGDSSAAQRRQEVMVNYEILQASFASDSLLERLKTDCGLPAKAWTDAEHVAIAAVSGMDFLLSWNCAHPVKPQIAPRIAEACRSAGYSCPVLCTPEQLLERYENSPATR